ncbi:MAG: EAL domain-containing protein [Gammaproteobacteria bacterium]|nr:EAL domain-containing protein [Gammaproteobacteria bacterium]
MNSKDVNNNLNLEAGFYADLLRAYFDSANDAIFVLCNELKFLVCNKLMEEWIGLTEVELVRHNQRRPITDLLGHTDSVAIFKQATDKVLLGHNQRFECMISPATTQERWLEINMTLVDLDAGEMIIAVARDVTERREQLAQIYYQASHDTLTDLPNRSFLQNTLDQHATSHLPVSILIMDISRFKDINEALGYEVADSILKHVAERLSAAFADNPDIVVGRLASDQFVMLATGASAEQTKQIVEIIKLRLARPIQLSRFELTLDINMGVASYPEHLDNCRKLLQAAESALHHAKLHATKSVVVYDPLFTQSGVERLELVNDLRIAIESEQITINLQPIVPLKEQHAPYLEVLARWNHPEKGMIPPDQFIPLAEMSGQIIPLTHIVIEQAITQCAPLLNSGEIGSISINISPHCLLDKTLTETISALIKQYDISPSLLKFEITEGVAMSEQMQQNTVQALFELGVRLSIDDFGTGHSSLSKLKQLPVTELKIDRSFITDMLVDEDDAAIVEASINLAHNLGLHVVAEGIEDEKTQDELLRMGCDYAQGYHLSYPLTLDQLHEWLKK